MKPISGMLYHTMSARTSRAAIKPPDAIRLLLCLAVGGVGAGAVLYGRMPALAENILFTQGLAVSAAQRTLWEVCRTALCPMLLLLGGVWMSGCAAFGQVLALALLFLRGMAFGLSAAACMAAVPLRDGLCIAAVLILPYGFCSILLLCHAVREALRRANRMTGFWLHGTAEPVSCAADPIARMLWILLLTLLATGLHTALLWQVSDRLLT